MIYIIMLSHVHANNTFLCHNVLALNSLFFLGKLFCYKPAFVILSYRFKVTPFSQKKFRVAQIEISNTEIYVRMSVLKMYMTSHSFKKEKKKKRKRIL